MTRRALVAVALLLGAMGAGAQQRPRSTVASNVAAPSSTASCPAPRPRPAPTTEQRRAARELAQRAQQAAILGDRVSAREQLRQAASLDPRDPDLAYQLARANDAAGAAADAASEYCRFLSLAPGAPEAAEARERVAMLAPPARAAPQSIDRLSPTRALSLGLVIPGAGQFYTGRPLAGTLAFGGAAAGVACALNQRVTFSSVQETGVDPFGNPYTYTASRPTSTRPCMAPGLAVAVFVALGSAIEAYNHVRSTNDERRVAIGLYPDGGALALALRVSVR